MLYLLRMWALAISFGILLLVGLIAAVLRWDGSTLEIIGFAVLLACIAYWWTRRQRLATYRETTPDRAIALYADLAQRQKSETNRALVVDSAAYAAILHGQFDRTRDVMESIDWPSLPPVFRSFQAILQGLLALFEERDPGGALQWMRRAEGLADVPGIFPGVKTAKLARDAISAACRVLQDEPEPPDLDTLHEAVRRLPGIGPALPAWALASHYERTGDSARSTECRAIVKRLTPHCVSLAGSPFASAGR
ncbi:MAG: hypothetical protein WCE75_06080 [Terracidiphilus sp.]